MPQHPGRRKWNWSFHAIFPGTTSKDPDGGSGPHRLVSTNLRISPQEGLRCSRPRDAGKRPRCQGRVAMSSTRRLRACEFPRGRDVGLTVLRASRKKCVDRFSRTSRMIAGIPEKPFRSPQSPRRVALTPIATAPSRPAVSPRGCEHSRARACRCGPGHRAAGGMGGRVRTTYEVVRPLLLPPMAPRGRQTLMPDVTPR